MNKWRVGNHYQIHVYEGDRPVATFHNPEDAQRAVRAVNERALIAEWAEWWGDGKRGLDDDGKYLDDLIKRTKHAASDNIR